MFIIVGERDLHYSTTPLPTRPNDMSDYGKPLSMKGCRESGWIVAIQSGRRRSIKRRKKVKADLGGRRGGHPRSPTPMALKSLLPKESLAAVR
jgi:hypothetical protein